MKWVNLGNLIGNQPIVFQTTVANVVEDKKNDTSVPKQANQTNNEVIVVKVPPIPPKINVPLNSKKDNDAIDAIPSDKPVSS